MNPTAPIHIVILAAGKGTRMCSSVAKVLHQVAGKSLLAHVLDAALSLQPAKIHIVVGHQKDAIINAFANHPAKALINWVEQAEQLGTGDAVAQAMPHIDASAQVLMLAADVPLIQSHTLTKLVEQMRSNSLCVLSAKVDDPTGLGRIVRDASNAVTGIIEHRDASVRQRQINEINSGIICARAAQLKVWLQQIEPQNQQSEYYLTDIIGLAYQAGEPVSAIAVEDSSEVQGINDRVQLALAERAYQARQIKAWMLAGVTFVDPERVDLRGEVSIGADTHIDINVILEGPTVIGSHVSIASNCVISASTIADDVQILANSVIEQSTLQPYATVGPFARLRPGTELGEHVKIGNFVETKNAKLSAGVKVNHLSYVGDATVGSHSNIGAGVITCNYDGANKHQTSIGENVFIGSNSQLVAPVSIGDGATIGAGSTITSSVQPQQLGITRAKQRQIDNWQRPVKTNKSK